MVRPIQGTPSTQKPELNVPLPTSGGGLRVPLPPGAGIPNIPTTRPSTESTGVPADALSTIEGVQPINVGAQEHVSPVNVEGRPELRAVQGNRELLERQRAEEQRDAERFAVTTELPTTGANIYAQQSGTPDATRDYLTRSAQAAGLPLATETMDDTQKRRHVSLLPTQKGGDPVENLLVQAENDNAQIITPGTTLNNAMGDMQQAWNVGSQEQVNAIGPGIAQTFQEVASDLKTFQFEDATTNTNVDEKAQPEANKGFFAEAEQGIQKANRGKSAGQIAEESLETFGEATRELGSQGPIRGVLDTINQSMRAKLNPGGEVLPYSQPAGTNVENFSAAAAVMAHWINQGWLTLGKDKKGQILPFLTEAGRLQASNSFFFRDVFNPQKRQQRQDQSGFSGNLTQSTTIAPFDNKYITQQNQAYSGKGGVNLNSHALSSTAITHLNSVFVTADPVTTPLAMYMFQTVQKELQSKLDGPSVQQETAASIFGEQGVAPQETPRVFSENKQFAEALGQLDEATWNEYYKGFLNEGMQPDQAVQKANKLITDRMAQIAKHFEKHLPTLAQQPMATTINSSPVTRRFFVTGAETSYQAHSGTVRVATTWANVTPTVGVNQEMIDSVARKAKIIFNRGGHTGEAGGMHVIEKLHNLPETELNVLDTLLVIGATYARSSPGDAARFAAANNLPSSHKLWEYPDFIKFGRESLGKAAERGRLLQEYGGQIPVGPDQPAWLANELDHGKGEWQYGLSVYDSARKLQQAIDAGGGTVYLNHQWETDSTQSNAFIMSTMMGDDNIMGLLGKFLQYGDLEKGDLRIRAAETLVQAREGKIADVENAFGGDPQLATVWKDFLGPLSGQPFFAKAYGRGIVVAGLYGKTPWKMFKEGNKFLSHKDIVPHIPKLNQYYESKFGDQAQDKMLEDVSNLFAVSMNRHMASLTGYQTMMKNLLDVLAVGGDVTQIESLIPNEDILLATEEVRPLYNKSDMIDYISGRSDTAPRQVTSEVGGEGQGQATIGHVQRDVSLASQGDRGAGQRGEGEYADSSKNYYGAAARAAISPNLIQSGDTFGIIVATLLSNSKRGPNEVPKNIRAIHDAIISGAGSTSLSLVAYNDVFPYLVQKQAQNYPNRLFKTAQESVRRVVQNATGDRIVIGDSGDQRALMGYYDRHWGKMKGSALKPEQLAELSPDEKVVYEEEGFFPKRILDRMTPEAREGVNKSIQRSREIVEFGIKNGWVPPLPANKEKRRHLAVNKEQFIKLMLGLLEGNGLAGNDDRVLFKSNKKGSHSADWLTQQMSKLTGGVEKSRTGQLLPTTGKQAQLADKLAKNGSSIKNMPLV